MSRILINGEKVLLTQVVTAKTTAARMRGLLGRTSMNSEEGLLILPCRSIHMWFMRVPIDAAFLDSEMRVLRVTHRLRPWQLGFAPRGTHCVLETAAGALTQVMPGDQLALE